MYQNESLAFLKSLIQGVRGIIIVMELIIIILLYEPEFRCGVLVNPARNRVDTFDTGMQQIDYVSR